MTIQLTILVWFKCVVSWEKALRISFYTFKKKIQGCHNFLFSWCLPFNFLNKYETQLVCIYTQSIHVNHPTPYASTTKYPLLSLYHQAYVERIFTFARCRKISKEALKYGFNIQFSIRLTLPTKCQTLLTQ
jgi:hypothetical protein